MQHHNILLEPEKTTGTSILNAFLIPGSFRHRIKLVSGRIERLTSFLASIPSIVIYAIHELLVLGYAFVHYHGNPNFENVRFSPSPTIDRPSVSVPTSTELYRARQGSSGNTRHQISDNPPSRTNIPTHSNSAVDHIPMQSTCKFICATQFFPGNPTAEIKARARQIALHCDGDAIYRFAPGTNVPITVSIDRDSFSGHGIKESLVQLLQRGLEYAIDTLNNLQLGIMFEFIDHEGRGLVELRYGGRGAFQNARGQIYKLWAETEFPHPTIQKYTVSIYDSTFEQEYFSSIPNILFHEFGHLLAMRHWDAEWKESSEPSVQYPAGDYDDQSIMGRFDHPGQLRFHEKDVKWLRNLNRLKEGENIGGKTVKNIIRLRLRSLDANL